MSAETNDRYLGGQVRARAAVILTRRDDLRVVGTSEQAGLDLDVRVFREERPLRQVFGVLLRGTPRPTTAEGASEVLGPTLGFFQGLRKSTYPVCLFFFTMREEQAFFSWLAEPSIHNGGPKLVHHAKANCVEFTDVLLGEAVDRVVGWYGAVDALLKA